MKYLITDNELLDYITGAMTPQQRRELEEKALRTGQSDLLLYAELADFAATGQCVEDIIGVDDFMPNDGCQLGVYDPFAGASMPAAACAMPPKEKK